MVLRKMVVRCTLILLLFLTLVAWCNARHILMPEVKFPSEVEADVQDSIRNFIHTGIYSHVHLNPAQVQVTTPVKVTHDGRLVSHELAHAHGHARARRDLRGAEHALPHAVHYNLTVDGRELRLDLRPSVGFITPALIVERHGDGERTRHKPHAAATGCHYTGSIRGQPKSQIALSACDGLAGLLRTEHGEYWIEPSNQVPGDESEGRPHVIFKRSAVDKVEAYNRKKRAANYRNDNNARPANYRNDNNARTTNYRNDNNPKTNNYRNYNSAKTTNYRNDHNVRTTNNRNDNSAQRRYFEAQYQNFHHRRNQNVRRTPESKDTVDRRQREYERLRRLESARRDPIAFRAEMQRRRENRINQSLSKSNSIENSNSNSNSRSMEMPYTKNGARRRTNRRRGNGQKNRRRRKRAKNCATKQPPYNWNITNIVSRDYDRKRDKYLSHQRSVPNSPRRPRSVSKPQHVEVLLVADKSMTEFHKDKDLETYLLTIMNMVSSLYKDPSIGNLIQVVIVKIIIQHDSADLQVSTNADTTLSSFCRWQQQLNPVNDSHPHHHDVAILVTRQDICSLHNEPCNTLGVAHVAGMCIPDRSCSVNEDNGIMLAHTITHELGHNFGLYHDTEKIGCSRREGSTLHIMTPVFEADSMQVAWSRCSKRDVTNFLDNGFGECLGDEPSDEIHDVYKYPELPAGVMYDAPKQCVLQFGPDATVCANTEPAELCQHLWCLVNDTCKSMLRPAASGTPCAADMWCQNQQCVPRERPPEARDGGWGEWGEWSECSRTCGGGVETKTRECNNPKPSNNGKYCVGDRSRYRTCNREKCPINEPSFREVQCAKYNNKTDKNNETTVADWVPYFDQDKPCELQCVPRNGNEYEILPGYVADGTPCWQTIGSRDMCISGVCYKVGCDWKVGSDLVDDACGECGGDGSACKTVQGIYNKGTTKQSGFSEVAVIPAGSRNVRIKEKNNPGNYISIGSARTRKFLLNGIGNDTVTEYFVAGSQAIYERDRDWEKVQILGPISEDIKVYQRIYRGNHRNPFVTYQYTVDRKNQQKYHYRLSEWSPCSATCGRGRMFRQHECFNDRGQKVDPAYCDQQELFGREALVQMCARPACPAPARTHWRVDAWQRCSTPCRIPGKEPTKHRRVYCVDNLTNQRRNDADCDPAMKPMSTIICADIPAC